jgi:hypothetical protein
VTAVRLCGREVDSPAPIWVPAVTERRADGTVSVLAEHGLPDGEDVVPGFHRPGARGAVLT